MKKKLLRILMNFYIAFVVCLIAAFIITFTVLFIQKKEFYSLFWMYVILLTTLMSITDKKQ